MDNNLEDLEKLKLKEIKWQKRNFWVRIILIGILIWVGGQVVWYHYGYQDPDDQLLFDKIGRNITCRQALYYYAEQVYGVGNASEGINQKEKQIYNITELFKNITITK